MQPALWQIVGLSPIDHGTYFACAVHFIGDWSS